MKKISTLLALLLVICAIGSAQDVPRAEVFLGYTYNRVNSASNVPAFSANGGGGQFVLNFGRHFGFVTDVGSVHNGNVGGYHLDTTLTNFLFGPRIQIRKSRVIPYFQVLFGGVYGSTSMQVAIPPGTPIATPAIAVPTTAANAVTYRLAAQQTAFAMIAGGGLDIKINRHVSFRPIGLDYYMTRLQNLRTADDNNQHHIRYTTGFNFTFGGEAPAAPPPPPPPAMKTCWNGTSIPVDQTCPLRPMTARITGQQADLCPGASITLTASEVPENAAVEWTVNGQAISQSRTFEFGTTGRDPGAYVIGLSATAPEFNSATTKGTVNVLAYRAPTGALQVTPEIWAGEEATITANFTPGQCGGELRGPEFSATEGVVRGNRFDSSTVRFDPSDNSEQRKTITIQARVADQKGMTAAEASVVVKKKAVLTAKRLPDIVFPANSSRVNNCGKRVLLEELKALVDRDPTGKVVFVGHITDKEKAAALDQKRAMNAAAVISAGQGICSSFPVSQVMVGAAGAGDNGVDLQPHFCGTSAIPKTGELSGQTVNQSDDKAKFRRVEVWFVPTGGALPDSAKGAQDASALPVKSLGCPK